LDQLRYVSLALPQGRYEHSNYIQPIVKIAAELVACDHLCEVATSGDHKPDIDAIRAAASESLELLFLQNVQSFGCRAYGRSLQIGFVVQRVGRV
jgi:hypothetical protein